MRNVTVTIPDDVARWARVWAAEHDTSVSALLSRLLRETMERESRYASSMESFLVREPRPLSDGTGYPDRDSLYDR
jgi:plasmid stability protein